MYINACNPNKSKMNLGPYLLPIFWKHYLSLLLRFCKFNRFPNKPWFACVCSKCLLKTLWEKEKLLVTNNFSFSPIVFYLLGGLSAIFIGFKNCCLQTLSIWKSPKFVIWERVKMKHNFWMAR
jgi:hypothetical protein